MNYIYWIYFNNVGRPEKIIAKNFLELIEIIKRRVDQAQEMPEWIVRGYR